ncbi:predicted protein [Chaetoceros tenuissimus]|uniref:Uncharacterized protein n=1 Tax=Chaetoceros tenuissimus TaxID=426638 RepID=A0AAD3CNW5_9STRA|nr:predicted protein [Chaetoceros tenuissimus]
MSSDEDAVVLKRDFEEIPEIELNARSKTPKKLSSNDVYDAIRAINRNIRTILENQVVLDNKISSLEGKVEGAVGEDGENEDEDNEEPQVFPEYTNITQSKLYLKEPGDIPLEDNFSASDRKLLKACRLTFKVPTNFQKGFALACPCNSGISCNLAPYLNPGCSIKKNVACEEDCCHFYFTVQSADVTDANGNELGTISAGSFELGSGTFNYQTHSLTGQARLKLLHHLLYTHHMTLDDAKKHLPFLEGFTQQQQKKDHEKWFIRNFINAGDTALCKPTFLTNPPTNAEAEAGNAPV